ncbi:hypothetical protein GCM10011575_46800 [Microlunatus endophyticus]|uniref:SipW-cognate class signal peptide n=1 Tax=Microlunatus endophyticus TaxID=1716077 RepID=A0A917SK07_9ACTN|nr:hypothetical protein [Microlunatus endophyticus]GGL83131.1 hypothetical protein GCM10011575_46800 [Microlunatus endophyticus]
MKRRLRQGIRRVRVRAALALAGVAVLAVSSTTAAWTDTAPVTGTTLSALTVPPATGITCQLTNPSSGYYMGLTIRATVPTGAQYSYQVQLVRLATPDTVIWSHAPTSSIGGALTYVFTQADIIADQPTAGSQHIDYYAKVIVQLANTISWQSTPTQINFDAQNAPGGVFGVGAGVYFGSVQGSTSPGGQPGQCTT